MAGAIRGITVEIGGDTTKLGKALADVNSKSKDLQKELNGVNSLLKMDPSNVTLLKQKQDLLTESISNTKEKLEKLKEAQKQVQAQFDKGEITAEQYRDFQREIVVTEQKLESLTDQLKEFGSVGAQQVAQVGEKVQDVGGKVESLGKKLSVVSAGSGAILAGSIVAFKELDSGYDTIITKTGTTGEALDELNAIADNIFGSMPTDMDTVGTAVGEINTRFGYTGEKLETLSKQFIQFAEINGVDLNNSIGTVDKILEQFNLTGEEASGVLDLITLKAQQTGIGADTLMKSIQDNGATFKDMGIGVNESVILLSQFEANGVNVETALKGLKKATSEYAEEGLSMEEGLAETINSIKNAKTETEALAIAQDIFGTKGANEMAKAIREGRINIDDLSASMGDYAGVVSGTYEGTLDPIDQGTVAMNNLKLAGSELGGTLQTAVAPMLTKLVEKLKALTSRFSGLSPSMQKTIVVILGIVTAIGPLVIILGKLISSVGTIMTFAPKLVPIFNGIKTAVSGLFNLIMAHPVIAIITAIIAIVVLLYTKCEWFRDGVNNILEGIKNAFFAVIEWFKTLPEKINAFLTTIVDFFKSIPEKIKSIITGIVDFFKSIPDKLSPIFDSVRNIFNGLPTGFQLVIQNVKTIIENFVNIFKNYFNIIKTVVQTVIAIIKAIFSGDFASIGGIVSEALDKIKGFFSSIFDSIVTIVVNWIAIIINYFRGVGESIIAVFTKIGETLVSWWEKIKNFFTVKVPEIINNIVAWFTELPGKIWDAIVSAVTKLAEWGASMLEKAKSVTSNVITAVINFFKELPGKIWSAITSAVTKIAEWGVNMKNKAVTAMKNMVTGIIDTVKELPSKFLSIGKDIISGLWNGISGAITGLYDKVKGALSGLVDKAKSALGINSPSRVFADVVGKQIPAGIAQGVDNNTDVATEAVEAMTDDLTNEAVNLNGATINRKLNTTFTATADNMGSISDVMATIREYGEKLIQASKRSIVLDSGVLVGETIGEIDAGLASLQVMKGRGA